MPSDTHISETIRLLEVEKLVLKHNNGQERLYSFAEVFLTIADQLSNGISSPQFESLLLDELASDDRYNWYLPHDDKACRRLIAVLHQNYLISLSEEEIQGMVPDSRYTYNQTSISLATTRWLPEKRVEAKYFLTTFGITVIKQLRKQLTSREEGSNNQ